MENSALCYEVTEKVVQHIVHCVETQGRHVEYLKALQTLVKAEGQSIRKTQDMVMAEVQLKPACKNLVAGSKKLLAEICQNPLNTVTSLMLPDFETRV